MPLHFSSESKALCNTFLKILKNWDINMYFIASNLHIMFCIWFINFIQKILKSYREDKKAYQAKLPVSFQSRLSKDTSRKLYQHKCFPSSAYIFHTICMLLLMKYQFRMMCLNFTRHKNSYDRYPCSHHYLSWDSFISTLLNA